MVFIFKLIAHFCQVLMEIIIAILNLELPGLIKLILLIALFPFYLFPLGWYFISAGLAELITRDFYKKSFDFKEEGLKDFDYFLSLGNKKSD